MSIDARKEEIIEINNKEVAFELFDILEEMNKRISIDNLYNLSIENVEIGSALKNIGLIELKEYQKEYQEKKKNKYGKKYRSRLIKQNLCTWCKKEKIRGITFLLYQFHRLLVCLEPNYSRKLVYNKQKCYFCSEMVKNKRKKKLINNICIRNGCHNRLSNSKYKSCDDCRRKDRNRIKNRKNKCFACHKSMNSRQIEISKKYINKRNVHLKCHKQQIIKNRTKYIIKQKILREKNLKVQYKSISSKIKKELEKILAIYFIFQEPFLSWKKYRFDIDKFYELNFPNYAPELNDRLICVRCKKELSEKAIRLSKKYFGKDNIHVQCYRKILISNRKKYILMHKIPKNLTFGMRLDKKTKKELKNILTLYYIFQENFLSWKKYQLDHQLFCQKYLSPL
ncbi:MAG: hypothetical protein EAX96_06635 [Candidatus Lokiarchaeota archaeon]|nr:hypothetical protein [Candidatus Lokiarchaeota archaeon]